jgi:uncharacterized protein YjbJ (UPF0337 family)
MNWAELQQDWAARAALLKAHWGRLTEEDVRQIDGSRAALAAALGRRYEYDADEAERAIAGFEKDVRFPGAVK